ncbi:MAG: (2Fe-2S) ferredoxin domain-containing protein [Bacteroidota bacterium]
MDKNITITICLGSSCYSRGNKETVSEIQAYLEEKGLTDKLKFKGGHCFGNCSDGPVMIINDKTYYNITPDNAIEIIDNILETQE